MIFQFIVSLTALQISPKDFFYLYINEKRQTCFFKEEICLIDGSGGGG